MTRTTRRGVDELGHGVCLYFMYPTRHDGTGKKMSCGRFIDKAIAPPSVWGVFLDGVLFFFGRGGAEWGAW